MLNTVTAERITTVTETQPPLPGLCVEEWHYGHGEGVIVWVAENIECCGQVRWDATSRPKVWNFEYGQPRSQAHAQCGTCGSLVGPAYKVLVRPTPQADQEDRP